MRMLSQFYAKALIETEDGTLLAEPSASPEIQRKGGGAYYLTQGCTYDQSMIWQNHTDLLRAAEILGIEDDPFLDVVRGQIPRLDPIHIGEHEDGGYIKEFREEAHYAEIGIPGHRHISQLIGLYPGDLINASNPEWMAAASRTLDLRGDEATGWAMIHRMLARARLHEAEHAHRLFRMFIEQKNAAQPLDDLPALSNRRQPRRRRRGGRNAPPEQRGRDRGPARPPRSLARRPLRRARRPG